MPARTCHYCGSSEKELRPYGPGGADVCFACAMETPEREKQTEGSFGALLGSAAAVSDVVAIGDSGGPRSVDREDVEQAMIDGTYGGEI